ncbi:DUF1540 domain-containing protein [Blautia liquoris]|jgi:hypothetical protein|uniref:DUF1540 domain-containing protein n=1 Tax=Blautia liquoris TaxID=2779518 RepID=A0A7M2RFJ1_9FIRM|nr:DUF1540 domain-containing protein [Blautia liquoris]QOV19113.1 DUF1540 domain-containing protein [Blautia liquoris]
MTVLNCSAATCAYNVDELCSKGEIKVGGANAHDSDQTSCESFIERKEGSMSNSASSGCTTIGIDCEAENCSYNEQCKCVAGAINVGGNEACTSDETRCSTFTQN